MHTARVADARDTADTEEAIAIAIAGLPQRSVRDLLDLRERARALSGRDRLTVAEVRELVSVRA